MQVQPSKVAGLGGAGGVGQTNSMGQRKGTVPGLGGYSTNKGNGYVMKCFSIKGSLLKQKQ